MEGVKVGDMNDNLTFSTFHEFCHRCTLKQSVLISSSLKLKEK